jgi:ABC-type lipoprotein export system ATPase subunit
MVECEGLVHIYKSEGLEVVALQGLDLRVAPGEAIAIVGRSGSGKTTLMNVLAGMETPSAGRVRVGEWLLGQMTDPQRDRYRRETVGYVWQHSQLNLMPELSASENVQMPLLAAGRAPGERTARAWVLLDALGLADREGHRPAQLSGGEQQRLSLAVALANAPAVLLADELTGELDSDTAQGLMANLRALQRSSKTTLILVTHDPQIERYVDRVIRIRDGKTSTETRWIESAGTVVADELVIMDRAGRLQLPPAYVEALGLKERVRVHLEQDHLRIVPLGEGGEGVEPGSDG